MVISVFVPQCMYSGARRPAAWGAELLRGRPALHQQATAAERHAQPTPHHDQARPPAGEENHTAALTQRQPDHYHGVPAGG